MKKNKQNMGVCPPNGEILNAVCEAYGITGGISALRDTKQRRFAIQRQIAMHLLRTKMSPGDAGKTVGIKSPAIIRKNPAVIAKLSTENAAKLSELSEQLFGNGNAGADVGKTTTAEKPTERITWPDLLKIADESFPISTFVSTDLLWSDYPRVVSEIRLAILYVAICNLRIDPEHIATQIKSSVEAVNAAVGIAARKLTDDNPVDTTTVDAISTLSEAVLLKKFR